MCGSERYAEKSCFSQPLVSSTVYICPASVRKEECHLCNSAWLLVSSTASSTTATPKYFFLGRHVRHDTSAFHPTTTKSVRRKYRSKSNDQGRDGSRKTCGRHEDYVAVKPEWTSDPSAKKEEKGKTVYQESFSSQRLDLFEKSVRPSRM